MLESSQVQLNSDADYEAEIHSLVPWLNGCPPSGTPINSGTYTTNTRRINNPDNIAMLA